MREGIFWGELPDRAWEHSGGVEFWGRVLGSSSGVEFWGRDERQRDGPASWMGCRIAGPMDGSDRFAVVFRENFTQILCGSIQKP